MTKRVEKSTFQKLFQSCSPFMSFEYYTAYPYKVPYCTSPSSNNTVNAQFPITKSISPTLLKDGLLHFSFNIIHVTFSWFPKNGIIIHQKGGGKACTIFFFIQKSVPQKNVGHGNNRREERRRKRNKKKKSLRSRWGENTFHFIIVHLIISLTIACLTLQGNSGLYETAVLADLNIKT